MTYSLLICPWDEAALRLLWRHLWIGRIYCGKQAGLGDFQYIDFSPVIGVPIIKITRSRDILIFIMRFLTQVRWDLYIDSPRQISIWRWSLQIKDSHFKDEIVSQQSYLYDILARWHICIETIPSSLIGWAHTQNDLDIMFNFILWITSPVLG